ncbi:hypothetical protein DPMN_167470 [Dreissena polymorpha]|uniref:Uncharacterized protein n=1 Tax=Dreissena polymorpha TaxID=45954 RepID=A0A9D4EYX1_DREPO|nr:hypothetical protein DPMN_167470 [Dreissena polymorpha]
MKLRFPSTSMQSKVVSEPRHANIGLTGMSYSASVAAVELVDPHSSVLSYHVRNLHAELSFLAPSYNVFDPAMLVAVKSLHRGCRVR